MKARMAVVGLGIGALVLTGCGETPKASGSFDETKYKASVKAVAAVTHKVSKQEAKTKRSCTGTGTKRRCSDVPDGFKTVTSTVTDKPGKPGKSAKYCVELDNVGSQDNDDVWFNVSHSTYLKHFGKDEGASIKDMEYNHKGC